MASDNPIASPTQTPSFLIRPVVTHTAREVTDFLNIEADWDTTIAGTNFFLHTLLQEAVTATSASEPDRLAAIALALTTEAPVTPGACVYFIVDVVVARRYRRKRLAHRMLLELISHCTQRGATELRLVATALALPLYEKLGFKCVPAWALQYAMRPCDAYASNVTRVVRATVEQAAAAVRLEACANASDRRGRSTLVVEREAACFVIEVSGKVAAAVWMCVQRSDTKTGEPAAWMGPVVARTPALAGEVMRGAAVLWDGCEGAVRVYTLLLMQGGGGAGRAIFEDVGFRPVYELPLMRKVLSDTEKPMTPPGRFSYALAGWRGT